MIIIPNERRILEKRKHRDWRKNLSGFVLLFALFLGLLMVGRVMW